MEFLGIGPLELLFVILIMLVVLGPGQLERTLRTIGTTIHKFRTSQLWKDISQTKRLQEDILRETGLDQASQEVRKWTDQMKAVDIYPDVGSERTIRTPAVEEISAWTTPLARPGILPQSQAEPENLSQDPAGEEPDLSAWTTPAPLEPTSEKEA